MITSQQEFRAGARAMAPVLVGIVPTGLAVGAGLSARRAVRPRRALGRNGLRRDVAADARRRRGRGAPVLLTVAVVALVSARLVFYGVGVGRKFCEASTTFRWLAPLLIVQPLHAVIDARLARPASLSERTAYFLGGGITLVGRVAGRARGGDAARERGATGARARRRAAAVPRGDRAPALRDRAVWTAALTGGAVAVVLCGLPYGLGAIAGACVGIGVGARVVSR
jgi:hypothetical protein